MLGVGKNSLLQASSLVSWLQQMENPFACSKRLFGDSRGAAARAGAGGTRGAAQGGDPGCKKRDPGAGWAPQGFIHQQRTWAPSAAPEAPAESRRARGEEHYEALVSIPQDHLEICLLLAAERIRQEPAAFDG